MAKSKFKPRNTEKENKPAESKVKDKISKKRRPVKKSEQSLNIKARKAFGAGEIDAAEQARKKDQDERTLYVRFLGEQLPTSQDEIKELHSDIKFVRTPRTAGKKKDNQNFYKYAFLEFTNEEECTKAKNKLATTRFNGSELFLDFVGEKSRSFKKEEKAQKLNPCRLFVCGLAPGVTKGALKEMFPKCSHAEIPSQSAKKGTPFGFVQFSSAGDAKSAFDAAQNLDIAGHKITVLYAKVSEDKDKIIEHKAKKRKAAEKKKAEKKKAKMAATAETAAQASDSDDETDEDEEDKEEQEEVKFNPKKKGSAAPVADAEADTEEEDDENDDENDEDENDENDDDDDENDDDDDDEFEDAENTLGDDAAEDDDDEDDDDE